MTSMVLRKLTNQSISYIKENALELLSKLVMENLTFKSVKLLKSNQKKSKVVS